MHQTLPGTTLQPQNFIKSSSLIPPNDVRVHHPTLHRTGVPVSCYYTFHPIGMGRLCNHTWTRAKCAPQSFGRFQLGRESKTCGSLGHDLNFAMRDPGTWPDFQAHTVSPLHLHL
jgi:hypothetical protein